MSDPMEVAQKYMAKVKDIAAQNADSKYVHHYIAGYMEGSLKSILMQIKSHDESCYEKLCDYLESRFN